MRRSLPAVAGALIVSASLAALAQSESPRVPLFDNLGSHHYAVTTTMPLAQRYFDQGLRLYYGFNHAESIRAFEEAARQDPDCAMCYWGIALAHGPNINAPMEREAALAAHDAIQKATAHAPKAAENERALIRALAARYTADPPEDRSALDAAYTREMRDVVRRYPKDLEAATLLAEAVMDQSPWNYWTADGKPRPDTPELLAQLERVMAANPDHPGANHFYIHAVEAVEPERALAAAERLAALMPGAGHIVHMPGHIYIRVGRYLDAIAANEHAIHADEAYIRDHRPGSGMYTAGYYPHNYDFLAFAASMIGRSRQSIGAAEKLPAIAPAEMLRAPGMTFLQHHRTRHLQMKVRFSRWDHILAVPAPDDDLPHAAAMWNYARGRALAARGDRIGAEAALERVRAAAADPKLATQRLEFNTSGAILAIATEVLTGHIAASTKDFEAAVQRLRAAARLEDALTYGEPPDWSVPVRQELGMVLLRAERPAEAEQAFREDLKRFPENGWSLRGLELALRAQNRIAAADAVKGQFDKVWATADVAAPDSRSVTQNRPPIIDMHLHADLPPYQVEAGAPSLCRPAPCEGDSGATASHAETQKQTLAIMDRYNIVKAFLSGVDPVVVQRWVSAAPDRFIAAPFILKPGQPDPAKLRQEYAAGRFSGMGEIATQLTGVPPNDPALEPYFALAEELAVPVLIHTAGIGPYVPGFRSAAGTPLLLEDVLVRHPKLRLFVENAGYPYRDQTIAMMTQYPQLHADVSTITWVIPREAFYDYLQALVRAGLGKRLMFGSDQMRWPEKIGEGIAAIEQAPFLTEGQKRDILYHNASRFLRLDDDSQ